MTRFKEIHNYLISNKGKSEEELRNLYDSHPHKLAEEIAIYAHRDKLRLNGEDYVNHPFRIAAKVREMYRPDDDFIHEGVETLAILHDVIEDSNFTINDIKEIFEENNLGEFFEKLVKEELLALTHDKNEDYEVYIKKVMQYPTASLVKLVDLCDNLNLLSLNTFETKEYERCCKYLKYAYYINSKYHFIELACLTKEERKRKKLEEKEEY